MTFCFRVYFKAFTCLILLSVWFGLVAQDQSVLQNIQQENNTVIESSAPATVPVLTHEEAEASDQEAIEMKERDLRIKDNLLQMEKEWRRNNNYRLLKHLLLALLCAIPFSVAGCYLFRKKQTKKKDLIKSIVSLFCSILILLLLYSAIPYFYNFWSFGNLCLSCIIWFLLFKNYDRVFSFSKRDIIILPLLLLGTWALLYYVNPRMRDIPNIIVLDAETTGELTYNGTISNDKDSRMDADFLAHYKYIELKDGWEQEGSYRASLKKGIREKKRMGKFTLHLPTELIRRYDLAIKLTATNADAKGTYSINGDMESPWQITKGEHIILLNNNEFPLYSKKKNCPGFFLLLCITGGFLSLLLLLRLTEGLCVLFFTDKQKAFELSFLVFCVLFCVANLKNAFFIDNCSDLDNMASIIPKRFLTKHPPMIYAWWMTARFISPFESINTAFAFGTLISFWSGMWLVGSFLIRRNHPSFALFILLSSVNLVSSTMYRTTLLVDQIVVSTCLLAIGLCTRVVFVSKYSKIFLSVFVSILLMVISSVRLEGLAYTFPISIAFVSLIWFEKKTAFKRVFLSGFFGCILAFSLFSCYRYIISPYVFHAAVMDSTRAAADSLYIEALGICYFEKDWDDLPEYFSEEAKAHLDKTRYIERTRPYTQKYISKKDYDPDQLREFWLHMIKKYPMTYLHVKWIANQVLWRLRPVYSIPHDVKNDVVPEKTGLSFADFFRDGITTFGFVLPSWVPQLSLLIVSIFVGLLLFRFSDPELWIIWGIGASGFLHNFAFFLVAGGTNYRYIFWADTAGRISFILLILVIKKLLEYKQKKIAHTNKLNNNANEDDENETLYPDTLFQ